jgi:plasmid stabilization system protein ParE
MAFKVIVMPSAVGDLEHHADLIAADSATHSSRWLREAWELIFSLSEMPKRFAPIPESEEIGSELRSVMHYSHRIVYRVKDAEGVVEILRVWYGSRDVIGGEDLR